MNKLNKIIIIQGIYIFKKKLVWLIETHQNEQETHAPQSPE